MILAKNGESRLRYDTVLKINADDVWEVHCESPVDTDGDLYDLSC